MIDRPRYPQCNGRRFTDEDRKTLLLELQALQRAALLFTQHVEAANIRCTRAEFYHVDVADRTRTFMVRHSRAVSLVESLLRRDVTRRRTA